MTRSYFSYILSLIARTFSGSMLMSSVEMIRPRYVVFCRTGFGVLDDDLKAGVTYIVVAFGLPP